jgi:hypothetical protein
LVRVAGEGLARTLTKKLVVDAPDWMRDMNDRSCRHLRTDAFPERVISNHMVSKLNTS